MTRKYASVWDAIEDTPEQAASMKMRSALMTALVKVIEAWEITQVTAARRLDITQPRLNDLLQGRIDKFSLDALVDLSTRARCQVQVRLLKKAA